MDREKLEKAGEEYANSIPDIGGGGDYTIWHVMDAFEQCADCLMQQPLSERLTEEERKAIIFAYKASVKLIQETEITNPNASEVFRGQKQLLISIFGKDLFNDK